MTNLETRTARFYRIGREKGYPVPIQLYCRHKDLLAAIRTLQTELALVESAIVDSDRAMEREREGRDLFEEECREARWSDADNDREIYEISQEAEMEASR